MAIKTVEIIQTLEDKGLTSETAECFLDTRIFNLTNEDKLYIQRYIEKGLNNREAILKLISIKKEEVFCKIRSGHYDNLLSYYT